MTNLAKFAPELGFIFDQKRNLIYGTYNNFPIAIRANPAVKTYVITTSAKPTDTTQVYPFPQFAQEIRSQWRPLSIAEQVNNKFSFTITMNGGSKTTKQNLRYALDCLTGYLNQNRFIPSCEVCGTEYDNGWYDVNMAARRLCPTCYGNLVNGLEMNKQIIKQKRGNMFTGIVGAIVGALIGAIVWILVAAFLNIVSAWIGVLMAVCILKGYELLGGKINVPAVIICCAVVLGTVFASNYLSSAIQIFMEASKYYEVSFSDVFSTMPEFFVDPEFSSTYYQNLFMGLGFSLLGAIPTAISMLRSKSGSYSAGRIDTPFNPSI